MEDNGTFALAELCPPAAAALADVFPDALALVYPVAPLAEATPCFEPGFAPVLFVVDVFGCGSTGCHFPYAS